MLTRCLSFQTLSFPLKIKYYAVLYSNRNHAVIYPIPFPLLLLLVYRQMTYCLRYDYGLQCSRGQVATCLRQADPEGTIERRSRRLVSRLEVVSSS